MNKVVLYYGPKNQFASLLPTEMQMMTISELAIMSDRKMREHVFQIQTRRTAPAAAEEPKMRVPCLVGFSDQYAAISESAVQGFLSFIGQYDIDEIYLQNPPQYLAEQFYKLHTEVEVQVLAYRYNTVTEEALREIHRGYSKTIIGQDGALRKILLALYPLCRQHSRFPSEENAVKPVVMLFYGPTGVGKTETAIFLSKVMRQPLFRRQLSMYNSSEFASYMFGGRHSQSCFAKDLMERESNIILLDEFDKPNPMFHSAFYQIFDEGIYADKNYAADVSRAVIICTSNYKSEEDAREHLGAPLFARFDAVIQFGALSKDTIKKIIAREYQAAVSDLSESELARVEGRKAETDERISAEMASLDNVRQIRRLVRGVVSDVLLDEVLKG